MLKKLQCVVYKSHYFFIVTIFKTFTIELALNVLIHTILDIIMYQMNEYQFQCDSTFFSPLEDAIRSSILSL